MVRKRAEREARSSAVGRGAARDGRLRDVFGREGQRMVDERGQEQWEGIVGEVNNWPPK